MRHFPGIRFLFAVLIAASIAPAVLRADEPVTVRRGGETLTLLQTLADPRDLWVVPEDLTRINGFVLKPEGACLDAICIPVRQDRDSELLVTRSGRKWFNVTALARKLDQPFTVDRDRRIWTFGPMPVRK